MWGKGHSRGESGAAGGVHVRSEKLAAGWKVALWKRWEEAGGKGCSGLGDRGMLVAGGKGKRGKG